jgi:hypothetical protein
MGSGKAKADDLPVIHISGNISASQTWNSGSVYMVDDTTTVEDGATLTINAGVIVKYANGWWNGGIVVASGGQLNAQGANGNSVIFTSAKDDSVGGDSNNDGSTVPSSEDYPKAVVANGGGVNLGYSTIREGSWAVQSYCANGAGAISIQDSELSSTVELSNCGHNMATMQRNHFTVGAGYAIRANYSDMSGIILTGVNKNTFTGTGQAVTVFANDSQVSAYTDWEVSNESGATLYLDNLTLNGALSLDAGVVVKNYAYWDSRGIIVNPGAELTINGTTTSPVVFTSVKDDSIAGDTGGDGPTIASSGDYVAALTGGGGQISVQHAIFRDAVYSLNSPCNASSIQPMNINDSLFNSGLYLTNCAQGIVGLKRNHFAVNSSYAIQANSTDMMGVALSGSDENTFEGTGRANTIAWTNAQVPAASVCEVGSDTGVALDVDSISVNGELNIQPGLLIKEYANWSNSGFTVNQGGVLNVNGSTASPIIFTSDKDDTAGGDTNGNGTSAGSPGDYSTVVAVDGGAVNLQDVSIEYASNTFNVSSGTLAASSVSIADSDKGLYATGGQVNMSSVSMTHMGTGIQAADITGPKIVFRGSMADVTGNYVRSCSWNQDCSIDAAYVDWGTQGGPQSKVCGKATISPWQYSGSSHTAPLFTPNCDNAPTPQDTLGSSIAGFQNRVSRDEIDCSNGLQDACSAYHQAYVCLSGALDSAESTSPWPLPPTGNDEQVTAFGGQVTAAAESYITAREEVTVGGFSFSVANELVKVIDTFTHLSSAYSSCG